MTEEIVEKKPEDAAKKTSPKTPKLKYNPADFWFNVGERVSEETKAENIPIWKDLSRVGRGIWGFIFLIPYLLVIQNESSIIFISSSLFFKIFIFLIYLPYIVWFIYFIFKSLYIEYKKTSKSKNEILRQVLLFLLVSMISIVFLFISLESIWNLIIYFNNFIYNKIAQGYMEGIILPFILMIFLSIIVFPIIFLITVISFMSFLYEEWKVVKIMYINYRLDKLSQDILANLMILSQLIMVIFIMITMIKTDPEIFFINHDIYASLKISCFYLFYSLLLSNIHCSVIKQYRLSLLTSKPRKKATKKSSPKTKQVPA